MDSGQTYVELNNGFRIPALGLGTFMAPPNQVRHSVRIAIETGYRHIDCAAIYGNETEVGEALKEQLVEKKSVKREEMFITSKLWSDSYRPEAVRPALDMSLKKLGLDYLDLYLIHTPVSFKLKEGHKWNRLDGSSLELIDVSLEETWKAMEKLVVSGLVKSIGISNFNISQVERILKVCSIKPVTNQIEASVNWMNSKLVDYCQSNGIAITAYAPFGSPGVITNSPIASILDDDLVKKIAEKHGKTPANILIRHGMQRGFSVLAKSVTPQRVVSNFQVFDFKLTDEEMQMLNTHGSDIRLFTMPYAVGMPEYPFDDEN